MADRFTSSQRSEVMAKIKSRNTKPELVVRRLLHSMGYRFRLHAKDLPGSPDIVFRKRKRAIFVHGCFWHAHENCPRSKRPTSNTDFWDAKLNRNIDRDRQAQEALRTSGWKTLVVWQCEIKNIERLAQVLSDFIEE